MRSLTRFLAVATILLAAAGARTAGAVLYNHAQTLLNPSPSTDGHFGFSVATAGSVVVVGAPGDDTGATDAGAAHLFDAATGTLLLTIPNPTPGAADEFGAAVGAVGTNVLVGAPAFGAPGVGGAVYLFDGDPGSLTFGSLLHTFTNPTAATDDAFGRNLAVIGTDVVVGAPLDDTGATDAGAVYRFDADPGSVGFGSLVQTYSNPTPGVNDRFGGVVAVVGTDVLASAHLDDTAAVDGGAVYLFAGGTATLLQTYLDPTPVASEVFGLALAGVGADVLIGHGGEAPSDTGAAFLFDTAGGLLHTFQEPAPTVAHLFGVSVAAVGSDVLVGASHYSFATDGGSAYLFDVAGTLLATFQRPTALGGDSFGNAVAAMGTNVVVGAYRDDAGATNAGAVYLFEHCGNGSVGGPEECDDGAGNGADNCCSATCTLVDDDGDGVCNAADPCTGPQAAARPKIVITRVDTPPGDDKLKMKAELTFSLPFTPALDPLANGIRVLIDDTVGNLLDLTIPGGGFADPPGAGWKVNATVPISKWTWVDNTLAPPSNITTVVVQDKSTKVPGLVKVRVRGKNGSFGTFTANPPLRALLVLDSPTAETGQCGELTFPGPPPDVPSCGFNATGSVFKCK